MTTFEEYKAKQLEILHELDRVCKLAGIQYFLAYGTCLGAVRHKGCIPWDDDIDIFLPCQEMQKLLDNRHLFKEQYFVQTRDTDPGYTNMKVSLRDSSTSYFGDENDDQDINHGMSIDLYNLYPYPDRFLTAHKLIIDSYVLRILYMKTPPRHHGKKGKLVYDLIHGLYAGKRAEKKIRKIEAKLANNGGSKYYASFFGDDITPVSCFKFPRKNFESCKELMFEDYMAPCPADPEQICELTYGKTYMEYPPEEERVPRHQVLFMSCDEPYTDYKGVYYCK